MISLGYGMSPHRSRPTRSTRSAASRACRRPVSSSGGPGSPDPEYPRETVIVVWPCRTSTTVTGCSSSNRTPAPDGRGARPAGSAGSVSSGVGGVAHDSQSVAPPPDARPAAQPFAGSGRRTRMRPHSSQRATWSSGALTIASTSSGLSSSRQLSHRRPRRAPAPLPPSWRAQPLVERHQPGVEAVDGRRALGADRLGLGVERGERGVALGLDRRRASRASDSCAVVTSASAFSCASSRSMTSSSTSSSSACRRPRVPSSLCSACRSFGLPVPGVEPRLVARGAHPHLLDVRLGLAQLALQVADRRLGRDQRGVQVGDLRVQLGQPRELRQRALLVGDLVQAGVESLDVEQSALVRCGCSRHGCPSGGAVGCRLQAVPGSRRVPSTGRCSPC